MILAFAADDDRGLEGMVSYHFGRCPYYVFVEVDGGEIKRVWAEPNPGAQNHQPGQVPQFVASKGAKVIFAGGMGPRAQDWFAQLGVEPVVGVYGKIGEILKKFLEQQGVSAVDRVEEEISHHEHEEHQDEALHRIEKELEYIRRVLADLDERISRLEKK